MDIATKKLHDSVHEYLDDIHSRSKLPIETDMVNLIQEVADGIQRGDAEARGDMSPGQLEALQANEAMYKQVATIPEDSLSPGQREALAASEG